MCYSALQLQFREDRFQTTDNHPRLYLTNQYNHTKSQINTNQYNHPKPPNDHTRWYLTHIQSPKITQSRPRWPKWLKCQKDPDRDPTPVGSILWQPNLFSWKASFQKSIQVVMSRLIIGKFNPDTWTLTVAPQLTLQSHLHWPFRASSAVKFESKHWIPCPLLSARTWRDEIYFVESPALNHKLEKILEDQGQNRK